MLFQIHHQDKKDQNKTEMIIQFEIQGKEDQDGYSRDILKSNFEWAKAHHPLPEGMQWMVCNEKSSLFWKTKQED
jgi:hypothetical protein